MFFANAQVAFSSNTFRDDNSFRWENWTKIFESYLGQWNNYSEVQQDLHTNKIHECDRGIENSKANERLEVI